MWTSGGRRGWLWTSGGWPGCLPEIKILNVARKLTLCGVHVLVEWRLTSLVEEYLGPFPHVMWVEVVVSPLVEEYVSSLVEWRMASLVEENVSSLVEWRMASLVEVELMSSVVVKVYSLVEVSTASPEGEKLSTASLEGEQEVASLVEE